MAAMCAMLTVQTDRVVVLERKVGRQNGHASTIQGGMLGACDQRVDEGRGMGVSDVPDLKVHPLGSE